MAGVGVQGDDITGAEFKGAQEFTIYEKDPPDGTTDPRKDSRNC